MAAIAYYILVRAIIHSQGADSLLAWAIGNDFKGRLSVVLYALAIPLALVAPRASLGVYWLVAAIWLVPDRRIETIVLACEDERRAARPGSAGKCGPFWSPMTRVPCHSAAIAAGGATVGRGTGSDVQHWSLPALHDKGES